jgi:hypothetical protein
LCCSQLIFSEGHYCTTDTLQYICTPLTSFHNRYKNILHFKYIFALTTECGYKITFNLYDCHSYGIQLTPPPYPPVTLSLTLIVSGISLPELEKITTSIIADVYCYWGVF